jgi:HD-GYP domain-containing protein (c-di-GMP phosphodiesterase class II)
MNSHLLANEDASAEPRSEQELIAERGVRVAEGLYLACRSAGLYPPGHQFVAAAVAELVTRLNAALEAVPSLSLVFTETGVVCENLPLYETRAYATELVRSFHGRDISAITFLPGPTQQEVETLVRLVAGRGVELTRWVGDELAAQGVQRIRLTPRTAEKGSGRELTDQEARDQAKVVFTSAINVVRETMEQARYGRIRDFAPVQRTVREIVSTLQMNQAALLGLTAIKNYDQYVFTHSVNVCVLTVCLVQTLKLPAAQLHHIGTAALLHDIGMTMVPADVHRRPGPLSPDDWRHVQKHPIDGARILSNTEGAPKLAVVVAYEHHIHYNRSGYPRLVRDRMPNPISLAVGITNYFDAITAVRPYRRALLPDEAVTEMLRARGADFQPAMLDRFVALLGVFPPGTVVRLDTGEFAVVLKNNPQDALRPQVRIAVDPQGKRLETPVDVDLSEKDERTGEYLRSALYVADPTLHRLNVEDIW